MRCPACGFDNLLGLRYLRQLRGRPGRARHARSRRRPSAAASSASISTSSGSPTPEIDRGRGRRRRGDPRGCTPKGIDCVLVVDGGRARRHLHRPRRGPEGRRPRARRPARSRDLMTHDPVSSATTTRRGRDQQDGRRRLPPHPDRRGRPADRRRLGAGRLPPPRRDARLTREPCRDHAASSSSPTT